MALVLLCCFSLSTPMTPTTGPQVLRLIGRYRAGILPALFSAMKKASSLFRVFATLPDGSQIVKVRSDSIALKGADGTSYDMYIAHDMTRSPVENTAAPVQPMFQQSLLRRLRCKKAMQKNQKHDHVPWPAGQDNRMRNDCQLRSAGPSHDIRKLDVRQVKSVVPHCNPAL